MLKEGDKAPEVTGTSYDGGRFDLGAPGKRTVAVLLSQGQHRWLNDRSR